MSRDASFEGWRGTNATEAIGCCGWQLNLILIARFLFMQHVNVPDLWDEGGYSEVESLE